MEFDMTLGKTYWSQMLGYSDFVEIENILWRMIAFCQSNFNLFS